MPQPKKKTDAESDVDLLVDRGGRVTVDTLCALFQGLQANYGDVPVVFDINHELQYDSYEEKDVGYLSHCSHINGVKAYIDTKTAAVTLVRIVLDQ